MQHLKTENCVVCGKRAEHWHGHVKGLFSRMQRAKRKLACTWRLRAGQIPRPLGRTC